MRTILCVSLLCLIGVAQCGILSSSQIFTQVPNAVTTSQRIGGNFAYSTIESKALPAVVSGPVFAQTLPVAYATAPAVAQPVYYQSIFGSPFFNPVISSPFYPGGVGQAPVVGQYPIFGQGPIVGQYPGQGPIVGQYPGQGPIVGQYPGQGQVPVQAPVAPPPSQGIPQGPAPPPQGAVVDDDTVSVEAA